MRTIIACFAITAPLALAACDNNSSSANNQGPQRRNQAQSQLGRTAEMGRNLADQISEMIKSAPNDAGSLLGKWVQSDD